MVTNGYGICLVISVLATLITALRRDDHVDSYDWSMSLLLPFLIMGYWLKTQVASQEAALVLFAFINLSTMVLLGVILFSMLKRLGIPVNPWIKAGVYGAGFAQLYPVWTTFRKGIPEDFIEITNTGDGYATRMVGGSFMFTHITALLAVFIVAIGVIAIIRSRRKTYSYRTLTFYILFVGSGGLMYLAEYLLDTNFSSLPYLYMAGDLLVALSYDRAHMHDIAHLITENQKTHASRGYAAIGVNGWFLSASEKCYEFLPDLRTQRADTPIPASTPSGEILNGLIDSFNTNGVTTGTFHVEDKVYACEVSTFTMHRGGLPRGYLIDIRDATEENRNLEILSDFNDKLNREVAEKTQSIENIQEKLVLSLADMVENRDSNTGGHVKRTSDVIRILVEDIRAHRYFSISEEMAKDIIRSAPMHDLGKVSIDSSILNKPARLTPEEYAIMKTHSTISGQMVHILLDGVEEEHLVQTAFHIARFHHERWDGKGYPEGRVGEMIPLEARIMAVADVYDALVSKRVYKEPMSFEKAAQIMEEGMGTQFDPNMLLVFRNCREKLEHYYSFIQ